MSDQERDKLAKETDEESGEDVEAHHMSGRGANDEEGDDVEAHKHGGKDS